ncbi:hypothetical protein [Flavobacterium sp. TBRC 19031]|uniref:hypothetical protein n=1 Tax=Flavobacterium mekongense TaxID=3379707 RepID=UPI00399BC331
MEPNKLEKQFRDKLNAREIQPSAQAWDRLDAMLSVAEEKKTRKPFGFLFIAAGILVLVTLGLFFFNQNDTVISTPNTIVGTETKNDTAQNPSEIRTTPIVESQKQNKAVAASDVQPTTHNNVTLSAVEGQQKRTNRQGVPIINQSPKSNQIIKDKTIEYQFSSDVAIKDLPKVVEPKEYVFSNERKTKSDESLLADLDHKVKESTNKTTTVKVDPKSLLSQVDGEVEYSFREKMLQKINKNYQEVKVALANRNNE